MARGCRRNVTAECGLVTGGRTPKRIFDGGLLALSRLCLLRKCELWQSWSSVRAPCAPYLLRKVELWQSGRSARPRAPLTY